ncbi:MAG: ATP-binding protein [Pirellula sp.]
MAKILFVENDKNDYEKFGEPLQGLGWNVTRAENIEQAFDLLENEEFDVAILDRWLKHSPKDREEDKAGGDKILYYIATHYPFTCVLMLTNNPDEQSLARDYRWGAYHYLRKVDVAALSLKDGSRMKYLDGICRRGMQHQLARRIAREMSSTNELSQLTSAIRNNYIPRLLPYLTNKGFNFEVLIPYSSGWYASSSDFANQLVRSLPPQRVAQIRHPFSLHSTPAQVASFGWEAEEGQDNSGTQLLIPLQLPKRLGASGTSNPELLGIQVLELYDEDALPFDDVAILLDIATRITETLLSEKRAATAVSEANRYAAVGLSDKISEPLKLLAANVNLAITQANTSSTDPAQFVTQLQIVKQHVDQVTETLSLIHFLAGERQAELNVCNLERIVQAVEQDMRDKAQAVNCKIHIEVVKKACEELPGVFVDNQLMRTALTDLIGSSLSAISQSESTRGSKGFITIQLDCPDADFVRLRISDNGPNILADHLPFVFARYESKQIIGARLFSECDLLSVRRIIRQAFHGEIDIQNKDAGQTGVTYSIRLPVASTTDKPVTRTF